MDSSGLQQTMHSQSDEKKRSKSGAKAERDWGRNGTQKKVQVVGWLSALFENDRSQKKLYKSLFVIEMYLTFVYFCSVVQVLSIWFKDVSFERKIEFFCFFVMFFVRSKGKWMGS